MKCVHALQEKEKAEGQEVCFLPFSPDADLDPRAWTVRSYHPRRIGGEIGPNCAHALVSIQASTNARESVRSDR